MIGFTKEYSPLFELVIFKRDPLGNQKLDEPKERYTSNSASDIWDFWERRVGFLEKRRELAEAREQRKKEKKKNKRVLTRADIVKKIEKPEEGIGRSILVQQKLEQGAT